MSGKVCDIVFDISAILPNVINAINGNDFSGLKIEKGTISKILENSKNIKDGLILIFSKNQIIDVIYKKNINSYLTNLKLVLDKDNAFFIVIHDIENVKNQETALKMIQNYLNLILDNCN